MPLRARSAVASGGCHLGGGVGNDSVGGGAAPFPGLFAYNRSLSSATRGPGPRRLLVRAPRLVTVSASVAQQRTKTSDCEPGKPDTAPASTCARVIDTVL
ncbi:hypothetical protein EVAR_44683_1 [Eumeta japonica]|uniref:Uncharacterized protein n=1 Tax=Eumeta variegata TaxID=151549 RepID=A0A4C1XKL9_EUMVA|nr:hypothetical protein EVAR_44683_1 [Eumeta japonica]